jgi:hypothetical protein
MFGKVKKWLGIEGVKLELELPEEVWEADGVIRGKLRFYSMNPQTVTYIKVILIEKYTRGRGKEKLVDEYELGEIHLDQIIEIPEYTPVEVDFSLPFTMVKSEVDDFGGRNLLFGGIAKAARALHNVKSEYRVEAEAKVKGTALNPFDKASLRIK